MTYFPTSMIMKGGMTHRRVSGITTTMVMKMRGVWPHRRDSGILVTILVIEDNGDVETHVSGSLNCVNVEIKLFVQN